MTTSDVPSVKLPQVGEPPVTFTWGDGEYTLEAETVDTWAVRRDGRLIGGIERNGPRDWDARTLGGFQKVLDAGWQAALELVLKTAARDW